jgi:hypothetical protein
MPVVRRNPPRPPRGPRPARNVPNAPYALSPFPWDPTRPSILAVAHDESDGGALLICTDRPVVLSGSAQSLPLTVRAAAGGGGPVAIVSATQVLPVKWKLSLTGPPTTHGPWFWAADATSTPLANFVDPVTNHPLNAAAGDCADTPGPFAPTMANVVNTAFGDAGAGTSWAELTFDAPVLLQSPTLAPDDAIIFNGFYAATSVSQGNLYALRFDVPYSLSSGSSWFVQRQPSWVVTGVAAPQSGTF